MIVGFTGTQYGMSEEQLLQCACVLKELGPTEFHHGDCVGADEQANGIARALGIKTAGHPPFLRTKRAYCKCDIWFAPKEYLDRNHDIVDICEHLIVAPRHNKEQLRSGTWATYRYAMKRGRTYTILER